MRNRVAQFWMPQSAANDNGATRLMAPIAAQRLTALLDPDEMDKMFAGLMHGINALKYTKLYAIAEDVRLKDVSKNFIKLDVDLDVTVTMKTTFAVTKRGEIIEREGAVEMKVVVFRHEQSASKKFR